ncbi:hypothetical protein Mlute_00499 [Meiothermus luteus]|jgi:hypothetical protein|uniref:DUF3987 domain-containing protein n=1 Tax=Meiothermus luteus TaxID=2026184 RepID=A0A399F232_9DEIN|nr:YfjI family protein [Meiothermus luteus]RIH88892.1 hypothetical protein Mlute_00499 [Meiothermus luteus]RMH53896.1 MAG: DUF3987 domain-containing protein [Deinococcota bacterium]
MLDYNPFTDLLEAPEATIEALWPEPLPLYRDPEAPELFPLGALGPLEAVARETLRVVQAPNALVGASFLAAASMATQGLANVVLDGRTYPLNLYLLTIAESGERKSAVDEVATAPIRERQKALHLAQQEEYTRWQGQMAVWEAERKRLLADKRKGRAEKDAALEELGPPPPEPWSGIMLTGEPTLEGLVKLLAVGWPAVGLFSSEGGSFLGGYAMARDHRLRTIAGLSELWDGRPIDRVRAGDGATLLFNRRLALHLMAQPEVARTLLSDPLAQGQGILARMLTAAPLSTAGGRYYVAEDIAETPAYQAYAARLANILEALKRRVLDDPESKKRGLELRPLPLHSEAKRLWTAFHDHVERNIPGDLAPIRALASKLPEHALRLAGVLALFSNPEAPQLNREAVERGIVLAQFYGAEALRLVGGYRIPRELLLAGEVLAWVVEHCKAKGRRVFHLAEVYQFGPAGVRSAAKAREVLRILEAHHYIAPRTGFEVEGAKRSEVWEVSPHALPQV